MIKTNLAPGMEPKENFGRVEAGPSSNTRALFIFTTTTIEDIRDGRFDPIRVDMPEGLDFLRFQVLVWTSRKEQNPIFKGRHIIGWVDGSTPCQVKRLVGFGSTREKAYHMAVKSCGGAK